MNNIVNQKTKLRDIGIILKDIFSGSNSTKDEDIINKKLEAVYKVEAQLGVTNSIAQLEQDIKTHITSEKSSKNKEINKVSTRIVTSGMENKKQEELLNQDISLDR